MTGIKELRIFATDTHDCMYLDDQQATTLCVDPIVPIDREFYSLLSANGFRRSGKQIYRPGCRTCNACIAARVPVAAFKPKRNQKRVFKANAHLEVEQCSPLLTGEYFAIFERYIAARHKDGGMYPASPEQFSEFLVDGRPEARFYCFRDQGKLLAVAVADLLNNGLSAIYTFFDPDEQRRAPGIYAILWLIEEARSLGLDYLYLGYWIKQCRKMHYKIDYRPIELLEQGKPGAQWVRLQ